MSDPIAPPAPASHDPRVPTGILEESAYALFDAMQAAREAEERGDDPAQALPDFYRALLSATLLLPVPPGTQEQARSSLAAAVSDEEEVEIGVMLARDANGSPVSVVFGSGAALAAWSPSGTGSIALPARVVLQNLAASGLPAILDPAGPIPYRFEPDELAGLAAGAVPATGEALFGGEGGAAIRLRLPGGDTHHIQGDVVAALREQPGIDAYVVESAPGGAWRTTIGLDGDEAGAAAGRVASALQGHPEIDVLVLEEPMLSQVRQLTAPFHVGGRANRRR